MNVNQRGEPVIRDMLYGYGMSLEKLNEDERDKAIAAICQHLGVVIVRTNATKHGTTEIQLQSEDD